MPAVAYAVSYPSLSTLLNLSTLMLSSPYLEPGQLRPLALGQCHPWPSQLCSRVLGGRKGSGKENLPLGRAINVAGPRIVCPEQAPKRENTALALPRLALRFEP